MKIALVIERMDPSGGGRETSTAQVAAGLAERGNDVSVICRRAAWTHDRVNVIPVGKRGATRLAALKNFLADVERQLGAGSWDIVHATLPIPGADVYQPRGGTVPAQIAASRRRRSPMGAALSATVEPLNRCRTHMGLLERLLAADEDVTWLAVSAMVAGEFEDYYGRRDGVHVVYNAVDVPDVSDEQRADWRQKLRYSLGVTPDDPVFVTVAKNFPLKGVNETVIAFAEWLDRARFHVNARLVVIGRDDVEGYRRIAGLRQVGRHVVFMPPTDEVFKYYAGADACVLLSWYDPCSRVVLEATRWGIPSITTTYNGAAEVLQQGAGIVVASPTDRRAIMAAFEEMSDPGRRAQRAELCRQLNSRLSIDRHVDELMNVYQGICEDRR